MLCLWDCKSPTLRVTQKNPLPRQASTLGTAWVSWSRRACRNKEPHTNIITGNFVGPLVFKKQDAPRYIPGFIVVVVTSIIAGFLALLYRLICVWNNNQRDKAGIMEGFDHAYEDDLTDKKVARSPVYGLVLLDKFR